MDQRQGAQELAIGRILAQTARLAIIEKAHRLTKPSGRFAHARIAFTPAGARLKTSAAKSQTSHDPMSRTHAVRLFRGQCSRIGDERREDPGLVDPVRHSPMASA